MTKTEVKELLLVMLRELQGRYCDTMDREMRGETTMATNAYWKAQATIVDTAYEAGIYISPDEYSEEDE